MFGRIGLASLTLAFAGVLLAQQDGDLRLEETLKNGQVFHVQMRVELSGKLTVPASKDAKEGKDSKKPKTESVEIKGNSLIEYDERFAEAPKAGVSKTVRVYKKLDFKRTIAGKKQELSLRPTVRRLVVMHRGHTEVPFSPDGPLTWGEIDALRVDVFTPALVGLLPTRAVRAGATWDASDEAVQELTDLEKVEKGKLECKLDRVMNAGNRRVARVTFSGTLEGVGEDGPVKHRLQGYYYYDLADRYLSDLALAGVMLMNDKDGKEIGRIEGRFAMTRELGGKTGELTEGSLRGLSLEPDGENTQLLYDNRDLGVRFLHSRRWRIGRVSGTQVTLDAGDGSGVVITLDPPSRVPTARAFQDESQAYLTKEKARIVKTYTPARLRTEPPLDGFALEVEIKDQKLWLDYYVTAQSNGGATVAARMLSNDELTAARKEVDRIARSVVVTKRIVEKR